MMNTKLYEGFNRLNQEQLNNELKAACFNGEFDLMKFLLTSPKLKKHANMQIMGDICLKTACMIGHLEMVKYLLSSPDLKQHANIHSADDLSFKYVCSNNNLELLKYLIFDFNIDITNDIKAYLIAIPNEQAERLFNLREINIQLNDNLLMNNNRNDIKKPKL